MEFWLEAERQIRSSVTPYQEQFAPIIPEAVSILSVMLVRMQAHQWKKMATFRALHSWDHHQACELSGCEAAGYRL